MKKNNPPPTRKPRMTKAQAILILDRRRAWLQTRYERAKESGALFTYDGAEARALALAIEALEHVNKCPAFYGEKDDDQ